MRVLFVLFLAVSVAGATPYARFMDTDHPQESAAFLIDPNGIRSTVGVTDIAIITHSTADGSIMPKSCQQTYCSPENWSIFEMGAGGSARVVGGRLTGNAVVHIGSSVNVAPQIGGLLFQGVGASSSPVLKSVKAAMLNMNGNGVRLGYGLAANVIDGGVFQSAKEALPGQGVGGILRQASRLVVGYNWTW